MHPSYPSALHPVVSSAGSRKIGEPWLLFVRSAWLALTLGSVVLFVVLVPVAYDTMLSEATSLLPYEVVQAGLIELGIPETAYARLHLARGLVVSAVFVVMGVLLFARKSDEWATFLFSVIFILFGVAFVIGLALGSAEPSPLLEAFLNAAFRSFFLGFYLFPNGRFVPAWTRWAIIAWLMTTAVEMVLEPNAWPLLLIAPVQLALLVSIPAALSYRFRYRADRTEQQQIKWVIFGFTLAVAGFLLFWMLPNFISGLTVPRHAALYDMVAGTLLTGCFLLVPLTVAFAVLKRRLWDLDPLVNRALVYTALTAGIGGIYAFVVAGLGTLLRAPGDFTLSLLGAGLVAALFQPLRALLQKRVNRLMYGERDDPYAVISRLGQRLEGSLEPHAALPTIVHTVQEALRVPYVAIALRKSDEVTVAAEAGLPAGELLCLSLSYQGQDLGELMVAQRGPSDAFSAADRHLLADLARQAGGAVHAAQLATELQRSREVLISAREEERRRLRRDLHDGLGPQLAGHTLQLEAARDLVRTNPERAEALLDELLDESQAVVSDIRRLVYALRPPALDDLGLVSALREGATQLTFAGARVSVVPSPDPLPGLPAAVEVAAYRIAQEALTNVSRHAQASIVLIKLTVEGRALHLEVDDDGRGLPAQVRAGVGLSSMRERAEELGGTFAVTPQHPHGTRVTVTLPIGEAAGGTP